MKGQSICHKETRHQGRCYTGISQGKISDFCKKTQYKTNIFIINIAYFSKKLLKITAFFS